MARFSAAMAADEVRIGSEVTVTRPEGSVNKKAPRDHGRRNQAATAQTTLNQPRCCRAEFLCDYRFRAGTRMFAVKRENLIKTEKIPVAFCARFTRG
jgi:hypothetical protein